MQIMEEIAFFASRCITRPVWAGRKVHKLFVHVLFFRPIEEQMEEISGTELYRVMKSFPKGGHMHSHESKTSDHCIFLSVT